MPFTAWGQLMNEIRGATDDARHAIGDWFSSLYGDLHIMAAACEGALRDSRGTKAGLTERNLRAIQPAAAAFLRKRGTAAQQQQRNERRAGTAGFVSVIPPMAPHTPAGPISPPIASLSPAP